MVILTLPSFFATANANTDKGVDTSSIPQGKFLGAKQTTHPEWFKESFLEFEDDIDEATMEGKRVVLYFHQDGCPYCNLLVEKNFNDPLISDKIRNRFDLIAINMWGDKEVVQVGGRTFTEKTLAAALSVNFTPTLLFFTEDREVALRLDGYHPPEKFVHALDYVSGKQEKISTYPAYLSRINQKSDDVPLNENRWTRSPPFDLSQLGDKPIALLFEEPNCSSCNLLYQKTFQDPSAEDLLEQFHVVQLNRWSNTPITKPDGSPTTAKEWATELNLGFSPSIVFFDQQGTNVMTIDAMFKTFHTLGVFDYIASKTYRSEPSFQRYLTERAEHLRSLGQDVDIWSY